MRKKGVDIFSIGQKKYEGSRAFEMYAVTRRRGPAKWASFSQLVQ
jgi:hypothetical protein